MNKKNNPINHLNSCLSEISPELQELVIKEYVAQNHKYAITPPSENNKRWSTYVKIEGIKKRKFVQKTKEMDLYLYLYQFYTDELTPTPTLEEYFHELIKFNSQFRKTRTLERATQRWNKYYATKPIVKQKINTITYKVLENFYIDLCNKNTITKKEFSNIFCIINQIMNLAIRNDIIYTNPCDKVDKRLFNLKHNPRKKSETEVLYPEEENALITILDEELKNNPNNQKALAIKLELNLGLRIGELTTLKFNDVEKINDCTFLNISRTDTITPDIDLDKLTFSNYKHTVIEQTKTNNSAGNRLIPLTPSAQKIINELKTIHKRQCFNDEDYIFFDKYGRINTSRLEKYIKKMCKKAGINGYSMHDIRRTFCSKAVYNGITLPDIGKLLGHTNLRTTAKYLYPITGNIALYHKLSNAID